MNEQRLRELVSAFAKNDLPGIGNRGHPHEPQPDDFFAIAESRQQGIGAGIRFCPDQVNAEGRTIGVAIKTFTIRYRADVVWIYIVKNAVRCRSNRSDGLIGIKLVRQEFSDIANRKLRAGVGGTNKQ